jgi:hypothetical protein
VDESGVKAGGQSWRGPARAVKCGGVQHRGDTPSLEETSANSHDRQARLAASVTVEAAASERASDDSVQVSSDGMLAGSGGIVRAVAACGRVAVAMGGGRAMAVVSMGACGLKCVKARAGGRGQIGFRYTYDGQNLALIG